MESLDWSACMPIPMDIRVLYSVECGFYLHSIYATLYMDERRKDFVVMLCHHVLTLVLIIVSYATRQAMLTLFDSKPQGFSCSLMTDTTRSA